MMWLILRNLSALLLGIALGIAAIGCGDGGDGQSCRTFAIEGTYTTGTQTYEFMGVFDQQANEYRLTSDSGDIVLATYAYDSLDDFISESSVMGKQLFVKKTSLEITNSIHTYSYDADKLLVRDSNANGDEVTFTEWDSRGRPTIGTVNITSAACTNINMTIVYDDAAHTRTETLDVNDGDGTGCILLGKEWINRITYDSNGMVVEYTVKSDLTGNQTLIKVSITKTDSICH